MYTTNCPKCKVLEAKLKQKNIDFNVVDDEKVMLDIGFMSAPMLIVDGEVMDFSVAINWLKKI